MILVGVCAGPSDKYERIAAPAIARGLPGARVVVLRGERSIFRAYNSILATARTIEDLEAVVLVHDDVELREPQLASILTESLAPDVARRGNAGGGRTDRPRAPRDRWR